jgi:hypothetical protein
MFTESFMEDALTIHSFISVEIAFYFSILNNPSKEEKSACKQAMALIDELDMLLEIPETPGAPFTKKERYEMLYERLFRRLELLNIQEIMQQAIFDKLRKLNRRDYIEYFSRSIRELAITST